MTVDSFRKNFWLTGKVVAFFSFFESLLKISFSVVELVFGHFRDGLPNEARGEN